MAISRAQMRRQLYMGGGIASLEPRQKYGLGSIVKSVTKAVKGAVKSVGDIASSDAGKLALLAAGGYYLGGGQIPGLSKFLPAMKYGNAAGTGFGFGNILPNIANIAGFTGTADKLATMGTVGKAALGIGGASLLAGAFASPEEAQELFSSDRSAFTSRLRQYAKNLNPDATDEQIDALVAANTPTDVASFEKLYRTRLGREVTGDTFAEGGRVGLANGGINTFSLYQNYLNELQDAQQQDINSPLYNPTVSVNTLVDGDENSTFSTVDDVETGNLNKGAGFRETMNNIASNVRTGNFSIGNALRGAFLGDPTGGIASGFGSTKGNTFGVEDDPTAFGGGYSDGTSSASDGGEAGADAASSAGANDGPDTGGSFAQGGIPSIPMGELRENAQGIQELDYRQDGGFVPVGIKEKADDVPAMLSKNEFVMTADAVRGMGNGSIENGAQKMYNLMKSLENRIA